MNNKKAQKQSIQLPFNLNLIDNRPQVDDTFKNAEKVNAPYLNDMVSPIYTLTKDYKAVYDKKGNEYKLVTDDNNTYFMRNDNVITTVNNKKFKRRLITEVDIHKYDYYDISNDYIVAGWNNADNTITISFNGHQVTSTQLFVTGGTIITSRAKIIDDEAIVIVYYDISDVGYTFYWRIDNNGNTIVSNNTSRSWYRMQARTNYTNAITSWFNNTYSWFDTKQYSPLINIAKVNNRIIFSLISRYGRAYDTLGTHFITVFDDNGTLKQVGQDIWPSTSSSTSSIEYKQQFYVYVSQGTTRTTGNTALVKVNDVYYTYDSFTQTSSPVTVSVPPDVIPTATGETASSYDDPQTTGSVYTVQCITVTRKISIRNSDSSISWQGIFTYTDEGVSHTLNTSTDTTTNKSVQWTKTYYSWETIPAINYDSATISWTAADNTTRADVIPQTNWVQNYLISYTYYQTGTVSWITAPNIILDNGRMYTIAFFGVNTSGWSYSCPAGGVFIESADNIDISGTNYTWTIRESAICDSNANIPRSNSIVVDQDFIQTTWKLNNSQAAVPSSSSAENNSALYREWMNTNSTQLTYNPGTARDVDFNYYGQSISTISTNSGNSEDAVVFTPGGFRVPISGTSNWFLLYNTTVSGSSYIQGISYAKDDEAMGTLVTPVQSLDEDFYIVANDDMVIYRDQDNKYWEISLDDKAEISSILDNRYIVVNTTSYWNCYDSELNIKLHYATDYNDRVVWGTTNAANLAAHDSTGNLYYIRLTASAINAAYKIMPRIGITSSIMPYVSRYRLLTVSPIAYNCRIDDATSQGIDIYYSAINGTDVPYKFTINPYLSQSNYEKFNLIGTTYENSNTVYLSPCIFTEYIYNQGNRDMAKETYTYYILEYVMNKPVLVYSAYTQTSSGTTYYNEDDTTNFFVLQGQFYGVINDKICSIIYDNGAISEVDPIIDIRGMKFIGNNPQIAFFWNKATKTIHSFTGDASLDKLCDASKLIGLLDEDKYFYDTMTQSIFIPTSAGLLVIAARNWYLIEDWKNVTDVSFSEDGVTHIINGDNTINFVYYPTDGYEVLPLNIETSFYGLGDKEATSVDKWQISLYDISKTHETSWITVGVRSLTDITVKSEEKTLKITPDMYDEWSHCVLINYTPKLIKGQGIRLYIKTPLVIQSITPHIADATYAVQTSSRKSM